ncbi:MAG: hypothetical protein ABJL72_13165 [Roseobacter sp.]
MQQYLDVFSRLPNAEKLSKNGLVSLYDFIDVVQEIQKLRPKGPA